MIRESNVSKFVIFLVIVAILLPLMASAGVIYVEHQQANTLQQVRTEEHARLRAEAATAWLESQAALVRGLAKLNSVMFGDRYTMASDFDSFITAKTGFLALGYADTKGRVRVETTGRVGRNIADSTYFVEAVAGKEYKGEVAGDEWLQSGNVTVLAVPVTVYERVTGIVYGVLRQDDIAAMAAKFVPEIEGGELPLKRWLTWLGSVYAAGIIPLLLIVYCWRRSRAQTAACLEIPKDRLQSGVMCQPTALTQFLKPETTEKSVAKQDELIAILQQELALASKRSVAAVASESTATRPQPTSTSDATPAAIIDKAIAAKAYKPQTGEQSYEPPTMPKDTWMDRISPAEKVVLPNSYSSQPYDSHPATSVLPAIDAMTGLYSQHEFEKRIAVRKGQPDTIMLVLSIDGLKVINEFLGKEIGDAAIMATAGIIKTVAGPECMAARVDGDKFVVLLTNTMPGMAEDIKKNIKNHMDSHNLHNPEVPLCLTIGAAVADMAEDLRNVWKRAERDMQRYKSVNRVEARRFIMCSIKRNRERS